MSSSGFIEFVSSGTLDDGYTERIIYGPPKFPNAPGWSEIQHYAAVWEFVAPPVVVIPVYVDPVTDTIRGGSDLAASAAVTILDTTRDTTFFARTLPSPWSTTGSGTVTPTLFGVTLDTGGAPNVSAGITSSVEFLNGDFAIDFEPMSPRYAAKGIVELVTFRLTMGSSFVRVRARLGTQQTNPRQAIVESDASIGGIFYPGNAVALDLNAISTLRIVRHAGRIFTFVGTRDDRGTYTSLTPLFRESAFPATTTGILDAFVSNGTQRTRVLTRVSNFTVRSHLRIGPRLLENKLDRPGRILGTVPAATLAEVGPVDVAMFGLFGEAITTNGFTYTLPPARTIAVAANKSLKAYLDTVIKD